MSRISEGFVKIGTDIENVRASICAAGKDVIVISSDHMNLRAILLAFLSAALFGVSTPVAKALLDSVEPVILAGLFFRCRHPAPDRSATCCPRDMLADAVCSGLDNNFARNVSLAALNLP